MNNNMKLKPLMREYLKPYSYRKEEDPIKAENIMLKNRLKFVRHMLDGLPELIWQLRAEDLDKLHKILYTLEITNLAVKGDDE